MKRGRFGARAWSGRAIAGASLMVLLALPGVSKADHVSISGNVGLAEDKRTPTRVTLRLTWDLECQGAAQGQNFGGNMYLLDQESGEQRYLGGVFHASGLEFHGEERTDKDRYITALLRISCHEDVSLHGSGTKEIASGAVLIPRTDPSDGGGGGGGSGGGGGGGGGGRGGGDGGSGGGDGGCEVDPPAPTKSVCLSGKGKVKKGKVVKLTAAVHPCAGHEDDTVDLYRGSKKFRSAASDAGCKAVFKIKMRKTATFRAVSPEQDADHVEGRSRRLKVKVA